MNIPNFLTLVRFLLIPLFVYTFFYVPEGNTYAAVIFILSGITDILDGYIARHYNQVTKIGTLLDPLADKLMILTVLTSLWIKDLIPFFVIAILMVKELSMIIGAAILYKKQEIAIPANNYGKAATLFFYIAIIFSIFKWPYGFTLMIIALLLAILAFVIYTLEFYKRSTDN
ncbi:MAG: CDP-diacylglycerol--glycerol-3-phosphate 3-phosphatidyltransferase [Caldanaerobacter subterraneus]|jgi:cardiolipin synthase|uniref:CDP-diacylglycerol--glycerol-3-phosphate 3-phosphatidyltransferase n=1 Tax=unclassified Thermoanaerobacter TaxID=2636821 RepID=UPI0000E1D681|nr:CDP-diacylglycerol--glycerol-3-phosphate 3-phosphatidyltransferase [Thermoanaerobacter sp. X514]ABY93492.1 CDP-diacylglycerol--glycerol-3-phosphate 3-phosphatidyltransferase [Thermoanaerobacter sp. X514]KUJ89614.1 MAG: CDP-diacylglycerol/glycerol-3-phosphate 3-phosphatidyltransferase [Thermoanaerobacter thermocopriae]KUK34641.1 MAG: CDP-diacylglycerol--glycerol-3-phosphate 3-phosphatidyltransferase [Caldanaerobacter subterraneus]HCD09926.1 CDP-diacylglycerol--glycerol-3-phosphate 3-phosphati